MSTHTPIPYWMSLPWAETCAWVDAVIEVQAEDRTSASPGRS